MKGLAYDNATVTKKVLNPKICTELVTLCEKHKLKFRPNTGKSRRYGINGEESKFHMMKFYTMPREVKDKIKQLMPPNFKGRVNELWFLRIGHNEIMYPFKGPEDSFFNIHSVALTPAVCEVDGVQHKLNRGDIIKFGLPQVHSVPDQKGSQYFLVGIMFPEPINK